MTPAHAAIILWTGAGLVSYCVVLEGILNFFQSRKGQSNV